MLTRKPSASAAAGAAYPAGKKRAATTAAASGARTAPAVLGRARLGRAALGRGKAAGGSSTAPRLPPQLPPQRGRACRNNDPPSPRQPSSRGRREAACSAPACWCAEWRVRLGEGERKIEKSLRETTQKKLGIAALAGAAAFDRGQRCSSPLPAVDLRTAGRFPAAPGFRRARRLGVGWAAVQPRGVCGAEPACSPG